MTQKKITSLILSIIMLLATLSGYSVSADEVNPKSQRTVYLHARGANPTETVDTTTVYMGDNADIYFAVDNPNKGDYDAATNTHLEKQYDMNGYTLRIAFDPAYLDFAPGCDTGAPIDYKIPEFSFDDSGVTDEEIGEDTGVDVPVNIGYFPFRHGSGMYTYMGKVYKTAYITVFYAGDFVPQKKDTQLWYNLAKLSLTPKKTGSTAVFMDIDSGDEEHTLELFAKNDKSDELSDQTFDFNALYGGYHYLTIKDKSKPTPPVANPTSGSYPDNVSVTLTQEENCQIFYTTDNSDPATSTSRITYTGPIDVSISQKIKTCAYRESDGKYSNTVAYDYTIVPERPYLFDHDKKLIPDIYSSSSAFTVYASDSNIYAPIADGSEVYYTFSNLSADNLIIGDDPKTGWVCINKLSPSIEIDGKQTVRLITDRLGILSDVAWYYFAIKPEPALASHGSDTYTGKIDVTLTSATEGAVIYYTTDGSDPKTSGTAREYRNIPITIAKDTTLRTVSSYDGEWSDKKTYNYIFTYYDDYGVNAFYPSGVYEGSVNVTLTANNPEYKILYHTGDNRWREYDSVLTIDDNTDIIAKAAKVDGDGNIKSEGEEYHFTYKIKPLPPAFAPESTQFTNSKSITIYTPESTADNTEHYTLYYTLDGSDPTKNIEGRHKANEASDSAIIEINKYTVISAVVLKDGESYSAVVTHSYDIVTSKPVKPLTTLLPGDYIHKIGGKMYSTQFMPVPTGTRIYYTVTRGGSFCPDPIPDTEGTFLYEDTEFIDIRGNTVIKAVAVNSFGVRSDIGIFDYTVSPEAPFAAPSATVSGDILPMVPVSAVKGSIVKYQIGEFTNEFANDESESFYIDTHTGNAFRDKEGTEPLGDTSSYVNNSRVQLSIWSELDGITGDITERIYVLTDNTAVLAPPYADKETGMYEERRIDSLNNLLAVTLYSLNDGGEIQYRFDNEGAWIPYTDGDKLLISEDTIIQLRYVRGQSSSSVVSYVYNFVPMVPVIELPSGTYLESDGKYTTIALNEDAPTNKDYTIWYRANGDPKDFEYMTGRIYSITHTMSFKAYVVNNTTGRISESAIHYYIIEKAASLDGEVFIADPFNTIRISDHLLGTGEYAEGIKLWSNNTNAEIHYYYTYTKLSDGLSVTTTNAVYDSTRPIIPTSLMDNISIRAWLVQDGELIPNSEKTFDIDFVHLGIPTTSLEDTGKTEFNKGTEYVIENEHAHNENVDIYYTLDGSDPTNPANPNRKKYEGETLTLNKDTVIKTVYYSTCGGKCSECKALRPENCLYGIYKEVGTYRYTIPTIITGGGGGGGGGGGYVVDKTRRYTVDVFGTEHPTHIGYINGYPDGTVKPEGSITRDEMVSILYRIKNHVYESPFAVTGKVFPDVSLDCWAVKEIEYMAAHNVVLGYTDGEFKPRKNLSRSEFAALIYRFIGAKEVNTENPFDDLKSDHWAYNEIMSLYSEGIMIGYDGKSFGPDDTISRAEVMTTINRILGRKPLTSYVKSLNVNPYLDLYTDKWYYVDVMEATITHDYYLNDSEYEYKWENIK